MAAREIGGLSLSDALVLCELLASHPLLRHGNPLCGAFLVGGTGLEPVTPSLSSWCSPN